MLAAEVSRVESSALRNQLLNGNLKVLHCPPLFMIDSPYLPVHSAIFIPGERLTFPVYVKVREEEGGLIKYLPYFDNGEILEASWLKAMAAAGITRVYVHKENVDQLLAYLNNHLQLLSGRGRNTRKKLCLLREHLHTSLHRAFKKPHLGKNIQEARNCLEQLLQLFQKRDFPWQLLWDMLYRDYTLYNHCINVALLGLGFLVFLQKPVSDCLHLGLAGLFHDVGLAYLDMEIVNKTTPLSPEERKVLEQHPIVGHRLLENHPQISATTLRLILEHHEKADGSGYPQGLPLARQHPYTRVIFLLECYDAMTNYRSYRPAHSPFVSLKILKELRGTRGPACEPATLKSFIEFLALA